MLREFKKNRRLAKFWGFFWAEDSLGYHTFLLSDPKKWVKDKILEKARNWAVKSLESGTLRSIKLAGQKLLLKIFGQKLGEKIIAKVGSSILTKGLLALLGIAAGPIGWVGTAIFVYTILRDIFPFIKKVEKFILGALALALGFIISSISSLVGMLVGGVSSIVGGVVGGISSIIGGVTSGAGIGIGGAAATVGISAVGGVVGLAFVNNSMTRSAFVQYQQGYAPIFYNNCQVKDIHKTNVLTDDLKNTFVAKYKTLFPNSLIESKIDQVINQSKAANFNPALAVAIWAEESHFSNYGAGGGEETVVAGNDLGCGVYCESRPTNFDESLGCFVGSRSVCNNACLDKTNFKDFMECYGPAAQNPNFISNTLTFYRELIPSGPDAIECSGGTTATFTSKLINDLLACYNHGGVINDESYTDNGDCLSGRGVPVSTIDNINLSVHSFHSLQCVGFAMSVEAGTGAGSGFTSATFSNAKEYYRQLPGYEMIPKGQNNVMVGDLAFFDGSFGHVGVVIETAPDMSWFRIGQAIGVAPDGSWYGLVNESGPIHITWPTLLGFLRRK